MTTKKIIPLVGILVISIGSLVVHAQNIDMTGNVSLSNDLLSNINPGTMDDVHKIAIQYCNKEILGDTTNSYLTIGMRPGQTKDLCIAFINTSERHQDLIIGFTPAIINNIGKQLCEGDLGDTTNPFYKMVDLPNTNIALSENNGSFTQTARIKLPKTATGGNIYGCIGFLLSGATFKGPNDVLGIRVARNFPMKIMITGDVYNFGRRDDTKNIYTTNKSSILKIIVVILALLLIKTIVQTTKKSTTPKHKK